MPREWIKEAIRLHNSGMVYREVAERIGRPYETVQRACNRYLASHPNEKKPESPKTVNPDILRSGMTLDEVADKLGETRRVALARIEDWRDGGVCIDEIGGVYRLSKTPHTVPQTIESSWNGDRILRFAALGDNQANSLYTQITHLHTAYDIIKAEGITDVYHTGDIDDGEKMRKGHEYEIYNHGADKHIEEIVRTYPKRDGITTHFLCGNHDASYVKQIGLDIGIRIQEERPDMHYLGMDQAYVKLTPNCTMELRHPGDGTAYALSYKIQKMIEAMYGGEKPNVLLVGHYHKAEYLFYRNVHAVQTGCFQAQTGWMRGKGIAAMMGFWIIDLRVDEDGQINEFSPRFRPFYTAIKDDWKNWQ